MNKTPEELALEAYLAGLTEKKARVSDNRILALADPDNRAKANRALKGRTSPSKGKTLTQDTRIKLSTANKGKKQTKEHRDKIIAKRKGKTLSPETCIKMSANRANPCITPLGIFRTFKQAIDAHKEVGMKNVSKKLPKLILDNDPGYKRITKEEYIMLTGKDL